MTTVRIEKDTIAQADVLELIGVTHPYCISIFLPTHIRGEVVQLDLDARTLEAEIRLIARELATTELTDAEIQQRLEPFWELAEDSAFWRRQNRGLAIYARAGWLGVYQLPYPVRQGHRLANAFHLLPLMPMLSGSGSFYLLALELERIRLFEGNRVSMAELPISDLIPARLEERVGYDYEEKGLQYRSHHQAYPGAGYHGHDEADRDRHDEIARYFRGVDQGVLTILQKKPRPLLLATQQFLGAIYREVSAYGLIAEEPLVCNLSECSQTELHRLAWERLRPEFEWEAGQKWDKFLQQLGSGKASAEMREILPALWEGRADSLFVAADSDLRGVYNPEGNLLSTESRPTPFTPSLLDWAIAETLLHGGRVYVRPPGDFPAGSRGVAALFRY